MEGKVTVIDNSLAFGQNVERQMDIALGTMAQDIEMIAAFKAPVDSGYLIKRIRKVRKNAHRWQVRVDADYAAYQERGMRADGSHVVMKYSRAGTGKDFLKNSGKFVSQRIMNYFRKAAVHVARTSAAPGMPLKNKTDFGSKFYGDG